MKNKTIFISKLILSLFITILLISFMIKTTSSKIIFLPFLICSFSMIGKNICLIMDKKKYSNLFDKLFIIGFLLFWFGFLIMWCYINLKNKDYLQMLFSLPFWIIGVYMMKQKMLNQKDVANNKRVKYKVKLPIDFRILISGLLVFSVLLSGILMLFFGIRDTYKLIQITKNYISTKGYYYDYDIYNSDEDGATYKLTYIYIVDGKEYSINTDYGTNYIPDENSSREIKYNPDNPDEAVLVGTNSKNGLIFAGAFFTFGSLTFILGALSVLGYFDKFKIDVVGAYIGLLFLGIGIGIILLQNGTTTSLIETIKSFGLWIFIPLMFIVVGIIQLVRCIFIKTNKK